MNNAKKRFVDRLAASIPAIQWVSGIITAVIVTVTVLLTVVHFASPESGQALRDMNVHNLWLFVLIAIFIPMWSVFVFCQWYRLEYLYLPKRSDSELAQIYREISEMKAKERRLNSQNLSGDI